MYRHRTIAALLLSAATIGLGIGVGTVSAAPDFAARAGRRRIQGDGPDERGQHRSS